MKVNSRLAVRMALMAGVAVCGALPYAKPANAQNLVQDPGFETFPGAWNIADPNAVISSSSGRSGRAASLSLNERIAQQVSGTVAGSSYRLSFWYRLGSGSSNTGALNLVTTGFILPPSFDVTRGPGTVSLGDGWQNYTTTAVANGSSVVLWINGASSNQVPDVWLLDDVELVLFILGPDPVATQIGLQANSSAVRSVLSQRAAAATFALDYDCSVFDQYGLCVSVGARNTQIGSNYGDSGETAGLLTAAYRVTQELRIGGFIDQNLVSQSPVGVDPKNTQPMLGAFAVYQENPNFSGLTVRAAVAYQEGDLRITRPELEDTEAGTGRARTSAFAFGGEVAYGFPIDSGWVAQPYAGLRRSDSQRRGYTETTSDSVEFPITYNRFSQMVTSGTAGLRLHGAITPEFSMTFGAGMEYDLDSQMDRYSGRSTIAGLETFSINASQQQNELRAVGSAGMRYMVASNQAVAFDASVRQLPYGNDPSITTMLRYSIGF
jgi:hypothetical protein